MTLEKYKKLKDEFYKKEIEKYKNTLKLFKAKDSDYTKYNIHYTRNDSKIIDSGLYNIDLQELKTRVDEALEELEELNKNNEIQVDFNCLSVDVSTDCDGYANIDDVFIEVHYTEMLPEDKVNKKIAMLWRQEVKKLLRPEGLNYYPYISDALINLLELFEAGKIDWEILQKCVYKDVK